MNDKETRSNSDVLVRQRRDLGGVGGCEGEGGRGKGGGGGGGGRKGRFASFYRDDKSCPHKLNSE